MPLPLLVVPAAAALALVAEGLATSDNDGDYTSQQDPDSPDSPANMAPQSFSFSVEQWRDPLLAVIGDMPIASALQWVAEESGGNVCAIGNINQDGIGAGGGDAAFREVGIGQSYNPDDLKAAGTTGLQMRAACLYVGPADLAAAGKATDRGAAQTLARGLTQDDIAYHAQVFGNLVARCRARVDASAFASLAGSSDYWTAVKLVHGLPGIISHNLPQLATTLGRAPSMQELLDSLPTGAPYPSVISASTKVGNAT